MCRRWSVRSRKGSTSVLSSKEEDPMDQHLAELQLLNSAAVVDGAAKMNGSSGSGEMSTTKSNGNPAAATVQKEKIGIEKKDGRRGTSNVERSSKIKHSSRLSDIDSLSPEVVRALQLTFGGKLHEIRSRIQPTTPSPPPTPPPPRLPIPQPTPPLSPAGPPSPPEKRTLVEPTPPSSPARPPSPTEKRIFVESTPPLSPARLPSPPEKRTFKEQTPPLSPARPPSPLEKRTFVEPTPPLSPARPPSPPEKRTLVEPTPPSSPARPPSPPEKRTLVERLADREGANMLIAYFSSIFLSGFILLATEEDNADGNIDIEEDFCRGMGIDSGCARLFGYILPVVVTASFFTFAMVFFVFDVSFSLFNILTAAKDFFFETKENTSTLISTEDLDVKMGWTRPTVAGLVLLFVSDMGFIIASSALLWISRISTVDPLHAVCEWRLQLLWMLGLMVMDVVILRSAMKSFSDPQISDASIHTAARRVSVILCVLLACTAINHTFAPDSKELRPCATRTPLENQIQMYEPLKKELFLPKCAGKEEPELLQCEWRPQSTKKARHLDWCEANQQCDWPRVKQIQLYERKDVCRINFPQCDWPLMKQIQSYEDKGRCEARDLIKCEWPWVKQIQLYEHEERCQPNDVTRQQCDWPWLKQIQLFEAQDRCPLKNPDECEWPWVKQIQLFESQESSSPLICRYRKESNYTL